MKLKIFGLFLLSTSLVIFELPICCTTSDAAASVVKIRQGLINGMQEKSVDGRNFFSYMGIPYAKPPVGNLRFKDPVEADAWKDVLNATEMPEYCLQIHMLDVMHQNFNNHLGKEDCLYLNVFTPKVDVKANLPVMVFIHGGGFFCGGAKEYPPYALLDEDIVLVVLNYRLNIFGFLSTEDSQLPGNYGIKDQIFALKWVQENIRNFGGNPDMVTIFGESAGGASVHTHILSPKSEGLFHRAIMQSGNLLCSWAQNGDDRVNAVRVGAEVNCPLIEGKTDEYIKCLQGVDTIDLLKLVSPSLMSDFVSITYTPRVDNDVLLDKPEILLREGKFNKVDFISGNTRDEGAFIMYSGTMSKLGTDFGDNFGSRAAHFMNFQKEENPAELAHQVYEYYMKGKSIGLDTINDFNKLIGDRMFIVYQDIATSFHVRDESVNAYQYTFEHRGEKSLGDFFKIEPYSKQWVAHIDDLFYLFSGGMMFSQPLEANEDLLVRKIFLKLWTNFAKTGNPTPPGSDLGFIWQRATPSDFGFLNITTDPKMVKDQRKEVREFHSSLNTRQNRLLFPDGNTDIFRSLEGKEEL